MLIVLALGAVLLGHVRGAVASEPAATTAAVSPLGATPQHDDAFTFAIDDDDDEDQDEEDDHFVSASPQPDDDAAPSAVASESTLRASGHGAPSARSDLGPSSGHPRPHEPPPRS